jgi:hypothetical protein
VGRTKTRRSLAARNTVSPHPRGKNGSSDSVIYAAISVSTPAWEERTWDRSINIFAQCLHTRVGRTSRVENQQRSEPVSPHPRGKNLTGKLVREFIDSVSTPAWEEPLFFRSIKLSSQCLHTRVGRTPFSSLFRWSFLSVSTPAWEEHWILKGFLHFVHPFSGVLLVRPTRMCILGQHRLMPMSNQAVTSALLAKSDSVDILRCIQVCILFVTTIQTLKL